MSEIRSKVGKSRILSVCVKILGRHKKYKAAAAIFTVLGSVCFLRGCPVFGVSMYTALLILLLNFFTLQKIQASLAVFDASSKVRNLDYLIIGDLCADKVFIPEGKRAVRLAAPGRSLGASYEILRHTFGILKETGGTAVLAVCGEKMESCEYTVFDLPVFCLSPTSVSRLHLEKMKRQAAYPFLVKPVSSLRLLTSFGSGKSFHRLPKGLGTGSAERLSYREEQGETPAPVSCLEAEIKQFCEERGIRLILLNV